MTAARRGLGHSMVSGHIPRKDKSMHIKYLCHKSYQQGWAVPVGLYFFFGEGNHNSFIDLIFISYIIFELLKASTNRNQAVSERVGAVIRAIKGQVS